MTTILLPDTARMQIEQTFLDAVTQSSKAKLLTGLQVEALQQTLDSTSARLIRTIASCIASPIDGRLKGAVGPQPALSPYLRPLPAPPVDAEVFELQQQLSTACQHVAELRATVPTQLAQRLTEHLQQCRPTPGIPASPQQDAQPAAGHSEGQHAADLAVSQRSAGDQANAVGMTPLSPAPADLQSMYAAAVQRMPALRAKLEEALERMDRVVLAIEKDSVQASPHTADLTVQLSDDLAADNVSPALQQALQSGKVVTRRQMTKDVNPVPYAT